MRAWKLNLRGRTFGLMSEELPSRYALHYRSATKMRKEENGEKNKNAWGGRSIPQQQQHNSGRT